METNLRLIMKHDIGDTFQQVLSFAEFSGLSLFCDNLLTSEHHLPQNL